MGPDERDAARARLKAAFREELLAGIDGIERTCWKAVPLQSRADIYRGMKCHVAECVARTIRRERERGVRLDDDLLRIAIAAFNVALDELAAAAVH